MSDDGTTSYDVARRRIEAAADLAETFAHNAPSDDGAQRLYYEGKANGLRWALDAVRDASDRTIGSRDG